MRAFALVSLLGLTAACDTTWRPGPNVLLFRETSRGCVVLLSGSDDSGLFTHKTSSSSGGSGSGAMDLPATCGSGNGSGSGSGSGSGANGSAQGDTAPFLVCGSDAAGDLTNLRPGIDVLDLLIDYGSDQSATATLTAPVVTLYVDGVGTTEPAAQLQPQLGEHTYYTESFPVPAVESNDVTLAVSVVDGFGTTVPITFTTYAPPIAFSLYRVANGGVQLVGTPPDPTIMPAPIVTSALGSDALLAGTDSALLVLDYGALDVPASKSISPVLSVLVNGVPLPTTVVASPQQCSSDVHTYFIDTFQAPAVVSTDVQLGVQVPPALVLDPNTYTLEVPPGGSDDQAALSVLRNTPGGWQLVGSNQPNAALGFGTLPTAASDTFYAGIDQLELVIDYGDLSLPTNVNAALPAPMVAVLVGGQAITTNLAVRAQPETNGHTFFLGTMTVPSVLTTSLTFQVTGGLGFTLGNGLVYTLQDPPNLALSLLVEEGSGCFTPLGSTSTPAGLSGVCMPPPTPAPSAAASTVDEVELVVDYGMLNTSNPNIPPPVATIVVDGVPLGAPLTLRPQNGSGDTYFLANFHAPTATTGAVVDVSTSADPTPLYSVAIPLVAPAPTLTIDECTTSPCSVFGAVGSLHIDVSTQGDVPQTISINNSMSDGETAPTVPAITTSGTLGHNSGSIAVPIPTVADGTIWTIQAKLGSQATPAQQITIHAPSINATPSCTAPYSVPASPVGTPTYVGLSVTVPSGINSPTMTISTLINDVPDVVSAEYNLTTLDPIAGTLSTSLSLAVPPTQGTWEIIVSVDGYIQTLVVTVT